LKNFPSEVRGVHPVVLRLFGIPGGGGGQRRRDPNIIGGNAWSKYPSYRVLLNDESVCIQSNYNISIPRSFRLVEGRIRRWPLRHIASV